MNPYATHVALLKHAVTLTDGPILELGAGNFSTPLLHDTGRELVSIESKPEWIEPVRHLASPRHSIVAMGDWDAFPMSEYATRHWGLVFVDFGGGKQTLRGPYALLMKDRADIVVCHDTQDNGWWYGYGRTLPMFRYRHDCKRWRQWTSALSDVVDVSNCGMPD